MNASAPDFNIRVDAFMAAAQQLINDHIAKNFPTLTPDVLSIDPGGRRYLRVVSAHSNGQRSAWAFIDTTNGDILKPESWKKPALHARGNLFDADGGTAFLTPYGPMYLDAMPKAS